MTENKRERGSGSLYLRGKIWWTKVYHNSKAYREPTGTSDEKKALKILRQRAGAVANGIVPDSRGLTYEDLRDAYLEAYQLAERKSLRRDSEGKIYLECVRRLDDFFARRRAVDIDADLLRKFQTEMRTRGYANGTVNRSMSALRAMHTLAHREERIRSLPYFPMLPEARARQGTLPQEKYPLLLAALPDYIRPVLAVAHATGMRLGEILGLTWANINFLDSIIRLETSKNGEAREIPFSGELETVLREQYAKRQPGCDSVCYRLDRKGHAVRIGNFRKPWRRCCVVLGLGTFENGVYHGLIFHDLRRTFVSDAEHAGAPRHEVMAISGHKSESIYKRYAIGNCTQRRAALDLVEEYRAGKVRAQFGHNLEDSPDDESVIN